MLIARTITIFFTIIFFCVTLFGCATTYDHGNGVIISEKKLNSRDYKPHGATKMGAAVGGSIGAVSGAVYGGLFGLGLGALGGISGPALAVTTLSGALIGGVIVGGLGVMAGAGLGYGVDLTRSNAGLYQFVVKPEKSSKQLTIIQYTTPIPVDAQVHILEKNNIVFLKQ